MTASIAAHSEIPLGLGRPPRRRAFRPRLATDFMSFAVGDEQYGVNIMAVREIKDWSAITQLPNQPDYMRGVLNLRGVIVPIIDLRGRFGSGLADATPLHVIIVIEVEGETVGLLVDRVLDIIAVDASQIQPVPKASQNVRAAFLSGLVAVENAMIALIDLEIAARFVDPRSIESQNLTHAQCPNNFETKRNLKSQRN